MVKTLDHVYASFPITKHAPDPDDPDAEIVYGKATGPDLDLDEQIIDGKFLERAMPVWYDIGNIRQMHSVNLPPAGTGIELVQQGQDWYVKSRIIEPVAVKLVRGGAYRAYSVGIARPRIVRDFGARNGRITDGEIVEISLVDRPANPTCMLSVATKARGFIGKVWDMTLDRAHPEALLYKKDYSDDTRAEMAKDGKAIPIRNKKGEIISGAYPVDDKGDLQDAISAVGRAGSKGSAGYQEAKQHIKRQARRLGATDMLPEKWGTKMATIVTDPEDTKAEGAVAATPPVRKARTKAKKPLFGGNAAPPFGAGGKPAAGDGANGDGADAEGAADDDTKKTVGTEPTLSTYVLKRLHDAMCPAYPNEKIAEEYPAIEKNGVAATLGGPAKQLIFQMLQHEVSEDAGSGDESYGIKMLGTAYCDVVKFLAAEAAEGADAMPEMAGMGGMTATAMYALRAEMHKRFLKVNKGQLPEFITGGEPASVPKPEEGAVQASSFRRSYISAGHAAETASKGSAIPDGGSGGMSAENFSRGLIVDGHERRSPGDTAVGKLSKGKMKKNGRRYYSNDARDQSVASMQAVHDLVVAHHPEVCPMDNTEKGIADADARLLRKAVKTEKKLLKKGRDMATPVLTDPKKPTVTQVPNKANAKLKPKKVPEAAPAPTEGDAASVTEGPMKAAKPQSPERALAAISKKNTKGAKMTAKQLKSRQKADKKALAKRLKKAVAKGAAQATAELAPVLNDLRDTVNKMASEPDPSRSPARGAMGIGKSGTAPTSVDKVSHVDDLLEKREQDDEAVTDQDRTEYLKRIRFTSIPEAGNAEDQLAALGAAE